MKDAHACCATVVEQCQSMPYVHDTIRNQFVVPLGYRDPEPAVHRGFLGC